MQEITLWQDWLLLCSVNGVGVFWWIVSGLALDVTGFSIISIAAFRLLKLRKGEAKETLEFMAIFNINQRTFFSLIKVFNLSFLREIEKLSGVEGDKLLDLHSGDEITIGENGMKAAAVDLSLIHI